MGKIEEPSIKRENSGENRTTINKKGKQRGKQKNHQKRKNRDVLKMIQCRTILGIRAAESQVTNLTFEINQFKKRFVCLSTARSVLNF